MAEEAWDKRRAAQSVTRPEIVNNLLRAISNEVEKLNEERDAEKVAGACDKLSKLAATIEKLDKKASVVDAIEVFIGFGKWLQHRATNDEELTPELIKAIQSVSRPVCLGTFRHERAIMSVAGVNDATKRWKEWCDNVQAQTTVNRAESEADKQARIKRARADYAFFVNYYFPHYTDDPATGKHTESAPFHIEAANKIRKNRNLKAAFKWARGHAKSTHMDIMIPMWLKCQKVRDINVMVLVGKSQENANTLLADLQAELQYNQRYINDFGVQYNSGSWEEGEFVTADGCRIFRPGTRAVRPSLRYRNHRPDYIVIDDLDDDELCGNETRVNKLTDWVKEALFGALDGGRGRFIMVGNLISKCSVLANICATDGVLVSQVNAIDKQGARGVGVEMVDRRAPRHGAFMGYRSFQKEMMNNPITEGAVFKHTWIKWKKLPKLCKYDYLVAYCDPSFKGTSKNDYKAIKLWGKIGTELHQIEAFVRQCSVAEWCAGGTTCTSG